MRVRPAKAGAVIRDPRSRRPLPEEGGRVPDDSFWRRRLRSGDVVRMDDFEPMPPELAPVAPLATRPALPGMTRHREGEP